MSLNVPTHQNDRLRDLVQAIDGSEELQAYWAGSNITAIDRMGINDHGPVHIKIMTNIGLRLLRLLIQGGVAPSVVSNHGLEQEDAEVVVVLACVLHDIGHVIHREDHEFLSLILAPPLIDRFLGPIYDEPVSYTHLRAHET